MCRAENGENRVGVSGGVGKIDKLQGGQTRQGIDSFSGNTIR